MRQILKILIPVFIVNGCCSPPIEEDKFKFTSDELAFLTPLVVNDTIYFENAELDIDTILIREIIKESYNECSNFNLLQRAPSNWRAVQIQHLPVDNWTGRSQNQGEAPRITYQSLFSMSKDFDRNAISFSISFRGFHSKSVEVGIDTTKTVNLGNRKIENCYQLINNYPERISNKEDIVNVYWTIKDGLVGYKNKAGVIWINKKIK